MKSLTSFSLSLLLLTTLPALGQPFLSSQFTSGDEGWTVANWDGTGSAVAPSWYTNGGNPGGYLRAPDVQGDGFWRAPASYRVNWSSCYGGSLSYDVFSTYDGWVMNDIYLVGNGQTLTFKCPTNPPTTWKRFTVKLDAAAGWQYGQYYDTAGPAATEAQIRSVLANITDLRIRQEYAWGTDDSGLDNVSVTLGVATLRFLTPRLSVGAVGLPVENLQVSHAYRLEQSPSPDRTHSWQEILSFTATNTLQTFSFPVTNTVMFYRAREQ